MSDQPGKLPPILEQLTPSGEQIQPVLSRQRDVTVTAGAGTGKTRTLVARYLSLLADGLPLRSLAAITFTKKAAQEMRNRVRTEIKTYLEKLDQGEPEYATWSAIYAFLDGARISTIHSLAADILRQHPAEMSLDPRFELLEEGQMALLKAQAVEAALAWASLDDQASQLFVSLGDWALRRLLGRMLNARLDVEEVFSATPGDLWERWKPRLLGPIQEFVRHPAVTARMASILESSKSGLLERAEAAGDPLVEHLRIVIKVWENIFVAAGQEDWAAVSRQLGMLRSNLLQKGRKENWLPFDPKGDLKAIRTVYDELLIDQKMDLDLDLRLARDVIPALKAAFSFAVSWYDSLKTEQESLDYDDLESKSLELLRNHPEVAAYWQNQLQAILVDEYQDTNSRQRELVNLLNGGGKGLFIVGDGKQSIYRFRGADVAVFRQEQKRIKTQGENHLLAISYRAHPALIEDLNQLLAPVLGSDADIPYVEPFSSLIPGRKEGSQRLPGPFIELHLAAGTKSEGGLERAAEALAARISALIRQSEEASRASGCRPLNFGDVAVLCRASGSFKAYENAFERSGIPYLTISGQGFYNRPEIRDLLIVLKALDNPQDDLALAGLLRSPGMGFSDGDLLLLRDFQRGQNLSSLSAALEMASRSDLLELTADIRKVRELIERLSLLAGRIPVAGLLDEYLARTAYLAAWSGIGEQRSIENIKKFIGKAQASGLTSITDFTRLILAMKNVAYQEGEATSIAEGAVQIMTVHQAKGLEYPIVVLGDATRRERSYQDLILDEDFGLVIPYTEKQIQEEEPGLYTLESIPSAAYAIASEGEKSREEAESDRLLYVAATRAEEMLIISGAVGNPSGGGGFKNLPGWLGEVAGTLGVYDQEVDFQTDGEAIHRLALSSSGIEALLFLYESNAVIEAPRWEKEEEMLPDFAPYQELGMAAVEPREVDWSQVRRVFSPSREAYAPAWMVGEVVHRALALWKFPSQSEADFLDWGTAEFRKLGLFREKDIHFGLIRVEVMLGRFQDHELFERMDRSQLLRHEVPFSLEDKEGILRNGVIDALFLEDGGWVLVEFKTDEIRNGEMYRVIWSEMDYQSQVEGYLEASKRLLGQRPMPVLCFLDYLGQILLVTDRW
jgi:ATP-dependent helicase/nuclease subunit A